MDTKAAVARQRMGAVLNCGIHARRLRKLVLAWLQCSTLSLRTTCPSVE